MKLFFIQSVSLNKKEPKNIFTKFGKIDEPKKISVKK